MYRSILVLCFAIFFSTAANAQITPVVTEETRNEEKKAIKPAPNEFKAKYEGGVFGYSKKETGQLKFDDLNERIVFYGKDGKEKLSLPYRSMLVIMPQSRSVTSTAGNVIRHIPLPGAGFAGFITKKQRYLVIQYNDPDANVSGVTSFKLDGSELLESVLHTLGSKANMAARGEAYYRPARGQVVDRKESKAPVN